MIIRSPAPAPLSFDEPKLADLMNDPLTHQVLRSDGISLEAFRSFIGRVQDTLGHAEKVRPTPAAAHDGITCACG